MAAAMLAWPSSRSRLMARLRSEAMTRGAFPVLTRGAVLLAGDVADPVELVLDVPVPLDPGGEGGRAVEFDPRRGEDGLDGAADLGDLRRAAGFDPHRGEDDLAGSCFRRAH